MVKEILEKDDWLMRLTLRLCSVGFNTLWQTIKIVLILKIFPSSSRALIQERIRKTDRKWVYEDWTWSRPAHQGTLMVLTEISWLLLWNLVNTFMVPRGLILKFGDPLVFCSATMLPSFCLSRWNKRELAGFCTDIHYYLILKRMNPDDTGDQVTLRHFAV